MMTRDTTRMNDNLIVKTRYRVDDLMDFNHSTGYKRKAFLLWCRAGTNPFRYGFVKIDM